MIQNERQYEITKARESVFVENIGRLENLAIGKHIHAKMHQAQMESLKSQLETLHQEIVEWEERSRKDKSVEREDDNQKAV